MKLIDLSQFESKTYSQNGEDGVIKKIFECVGAPSHYYVEFGVEDGSECNSRNLRESGWSGLLMDGKHHNPEIGLYQEFVTAENINALLAKYSVPSEFDLLSIDIDLNDFYVWSALSDQYRPRVIVIEYNSTHLPEEDKVVLYKPQALWDGTNYFGASILALYRLGRLRGYSLVYANDTGVNLFFIRDDLLAQSTHTFKNINNVPALYKHPKYGPRLGSIRGHTQDPFDRPYDSSQTILAKN